MLNRGETFLYIGAKASNNDIRESVIPRGPGLKVLVIGAQLSPYSGTSKVSLEIIRGLREIGCTVDSCFLSTGRDVGLFTGLPVPQISTLESPKTRLVSTAIQLPLISTIWRHGFTRDDAVDVIGALTSRDLLRRLRGSDVVVFMNFWSAFPVLRLDPAKRPKTIVFFHELPTYAEVPPLAKQIIRGLVRKLARSCNLIISVSDRIRTGVETETGLGSRVFYPGIQLAHSLRSKEGFVLMDTRWTNSREPEFIAEIARALPSTEFVMAGHFPSQAVRTRLLRALSDRGVEGHVKILTELTEPQLDDLYSRAKWYLRWSAKPYEAGPSFGVFQAIGNLCPPIVDRELGGADFLMKNGLRELVVDRDPHAFATRLLSLERSTGAYDVLLQRLAEVRSENSWRSFCHHLMATATGIE